MNAERILSSEIIDGFKKLDVASVSDALDKLKILGGLLGLKPVVSGTRLCGQAFTVHYMPCGAIKGTVGDFIDDIRSGQVAVLDNAGRVDCTVWGDIMATYAVQRGISGTIIDGVCRDVPCIQQLQYPIFTKGCYMVTGKDRVYADYINKPVSICGVQVDAGDIILGDDSGVVAIPFCRAEEVLTVAQEIENIEQGILEHIRNGMTLKQAREKTGYHQLQTPK